MHHADWVHGAGTFEAKVPFARYLNPLLQLVGALVLQAQAVPAPPHISSMTLTRYYARIPFDGYELELSRSHGSRSISITVHAADAVGLTTLVRRARIYTQANVGMLLLAFGAYFVLLAADTLLLRDD